LEAGNVEAKLGAPRAERGVERFACLALPIRKPRLELGGPRAQSALEIADHPGAEILDGFLDVGFALGAAILEVLLQARFPRRKAFDRGGKLVATPLESRNLVVQRDAALLEFRGFRLDRDALVGERGVERLGALPLALGELRVELGRFFRGATLDVPDHARAQVLDRLLALRFA